MLYHTIIYIRKKETKVLSLKKRKIMNTNVQNEWEKLHPYLREWITSHKLANGDYSVSKGGQKALLQAHRTIKSQIPVNMRNAVISEFIYKSVDKYYETIRKARANRHKWYAGDYDFRSDFKVRTKRAKRNLEKVGK